MKLPRVSRPLSAALLAVWNAVAMYLALTLLFDGRDVGSAVAGFVVGLLVFGICMADD